MGLRDHCQYGIEKLQQSESAFSEPDGASTQILNTNPTSNHDNIEKSNNNFDDLVPAPNGTHAVSEDNT
jgi:hypothetical protein